ncbi:LOW QUALITY PROTEIN: olfactory receptor 10W1-like [Orycteropus afer afer]|uniref:Olfactory receptor n=1 Tax=Orycteropus afer afer TaxID=1230840 RepID=A0A8B7B065_ORYAF|nr:LOW QUALITY PROTEIN: olfactory receptor 10W1-like [Orycteropus afer afer]
MYYQYDSSSRLCNSPQKKGIISPMTWQNHSILMEFAFMAYPSCPELRILSFLGISLVYALIITGNVLIVLTIQSEACLHTPMYYFLGSLSGVEIFYTAVVVPHMLVNILKTEKTISFGSCATQMVFFIGLGSADCFLLAAMAYDRYVAIFQPLQYPLSMTLTLCVRLVVASVVIGFLLSVQLVAFIFSLPFCRARGIEHFFCDAPPVMQLVCANSHSHEHSVLVAATLAVAVPFFFIVTSYGFIVSAVLRIHSAAGRSRAFSTCSSHLTVVLLQYGCCAFMYLRPNSSYSPKKDQLLSLVYTLGTPLLNPLIYTLRNNEVKGALGRVLTRNHLSKNS